MEHPVPLDGLSAHAQKVIDPGAPGPMKMMAASGMAPLPPGDLLAVLYQFAYGDDSVLGNKARGTLLQLPDTILLDTLAVLQREALLDGLARLLIKNAPAEERIILNQHTSDETIVWLAANLNSERLLETICRNETRLLRCPKIIETLYFNRASRMSSVDRLMELAARHEIELNGIPAFEEVKRALAGELIFEPSDDPTPDDVGFSSALAVATDSDVSQEQVDDVLETNDDPASKKPVDDHTTAQVGNLQASLTQMTISQRIRMATLGTASQRAVLVRDSNKLVIMAVLKSPAVNEAEVRRYSQLKSLPEEAVRFIANKREWTKQYGVKLNLVNNPRTPIETTLRFLNHLRPNDLRALERSKDVPGVVQNAAKELRKKRMK